MKFEVYKTQCQNCLLSKDRIVSPKEAKKMIKETVEEGSFFICHKSSMNEGNVCCKGFFDGFKTDCTEIAKALDIVEFIEVPEGEKLLTFNQMNKGNEKR